jgi:serine/threonine protein kinase
MGIAEVQRQFTAYESGQIPEFELRSCLRNALAQEPELSSAFVALVEAYRRANLIDPELQTTLNTDIAEVTGPRKGLTMIRPRPSGPRPSDNLGWFAADPYPSHLTIPPINALPGAVPRPEAQSSQGFAIHDHSQPSSREEYPTERTGTHPGAPPPGNTRGATTNSTTGSSWETDERLNEIAAPLYPGSVLRDRFVLVEELGHGGMGVVYKAFDRSRGDTKERYVALKILNEEFKRHPLAVRALQREARKAQKLAHPNIATVYDFDRDGGNVYMVMELLSGRSLDQVLREDGPNGIPIVRALEIVKALAAALSYAHEQGIVHSDFKPSNAFLTHDRKVKVLDFGIARAAPGAHQKAERTTFDAGQLGAISPAYASLEMLAGQEPDVRDDVYALACVTYELLTGIHPFRRIDALKAHESGLAPRVVRKLSGPQWRALRQGLAFKRADRCPSVDAFASQLLLQPQRAKLWITIGAVATALAILAAAGVWQWNVQRSALLRGLSDPDSTKSAATVASLQAMPGFLRDQLLDTATQSALIGHFQKEMDAAVAPPEYDYAVARRLLNTLKSLLPDSDRVLQLERDFNSRSQARAINSESVAPEQNTAPATSVQPEEPAPPELNKPPAAPLHAGDATREIEILKEELETKAAAGDTKGASTVASALTRVAPGSVYVTHDVPQVLISSWVHLAKTEFAAGRVDDALKTLAEGRKHFGKSAELADLDRCYVAAGDIYDRLSSAVTINVKDTQQSLEALRAQAPEEYEPTAQVLARTLADRIADERAADRAVVADRLLQAGQKLFPSYAALLSRGTAGVLQNTLIAVGDKAANEAVTTDRSAGDKATADRTASQEAEKSTRDQTASDAANTDIAPSNETGGDKAVGDQVSTERGVAAKPVGDQSVREGAANDKTAGSQAGGEKAAEGKGPDDRPERPQ